MEKDAKAIRDPSDSRNIIGLKRTLEYMNGNKRRHRWFADEYVALERWGHGAVRILVRTHPTNHTKITQLVYCKLCLI